jgi:hypothetical protein
VTVKLEESAIEEQENDETMVDPLEFDSDDERSTCSPSEFLLYPDETSFKEQIELDNDCSIDSNSSELR